MNSIRNSQSRRPASQFESMFGDLDRFLTGQGLGTWAAPVASEPAAFLPTYEMVEDEQGYLLSFDLPGVPKDDIQIEVKDQQLRVHGERKFEERRHEGKRLVSERRYGKFERVFTLPNEVAADKIQAHHQDGVLHLMLPKTEKVTAKNIKIETGPNGFFSKLVNEEKSSDVKVQ